MWHCVRAHASPARTARADSQGARLAARGWSRARAVRPRRLHYEEDRENGETTAEPRAAVRYLLRYFLFGRE